MSEEIKEIVDKLSNRKQETLIQGLRECQLKDIEHPFITKEEYIDKILNYIKDLQQKVEQLEKENNKKLYTSNHYQFTKYELLDDYERILKINKKLENIRKEAIEYIENNQTPFSEPTTTLMKLYGRCLFERHCDDLLNILNKGSDKE